MATTQRIRIVARLRPRINGEPDDDGVKVVQASDSSSSFMTVVHPKDSTQIYEYAFSSCYGQNSTQEEIFKNDVEPLIDTVYGGVTVTIFAYGVTSSGKTHTMQGTKAEPGVIPRVVRAMFERIGVVRDKETSLSASYMEIYKDECYDLLVTRANAPKLPVRENESGKVFVSNLSKVPISSVEEFDDLYTTATKHRSVGATNLNRESSRSHAILTLEATMVDSIKNTTLTGKILLVDLAGSENNKHTGNDSSRMAESAAINKSLSVLGQVVHALNQRAPRIPYRNSKLTRILQDALGGSSVGLLICNLAPGMKFRQDTLNTLNFATRTKEVKNRPVVDERDNRPAPKPHFAAVSIQPPAGKPAPAILQAISTAGSSSGTGRSRPSLVLAPRPRRVSSIAGPNAYQPFGLPGTGASRKLPSINEKVQEADSDRSGSLGIGLTEKDLEERISKAVEAAVEVEVTRRLAERERQRVEEIKRQKEAAAIQPESSAHTSNTTLPSGVLTPLLKRHKDLDDELKNRLRELEEKYERDNKETQLAEVLSPVSKKKTGRAYVALARAHSEKGDLKVALDLYRKAETYVPDNIKLKERIIEIEWAVKNNKEYMPSPKPPKKRKAKKSSKSALSMEFENPPRDDGMIVDESGNGRVDKAADFGMEVTNTESSSKSKRSIEQADVYTPLKRQRHSVMATPIVYLKSEDEMDPPGLPTRSNAVP